VLELQQLTVVARQQFHQLYCEKNLDEREFQLRVDRTLSQQSLKDLTYVENVERVRRLLGHRQLLDQMQFRHQEEMCSYASSSPAPLKTLRGHHLRVSYHRP